jgi:diguanylate cyclase (GGDEF)-like protein/PAS domain S-box-containing protein
MSLGSMGQGQSQKGAGAVGNSGQIAILHLAMVGVFLLDLALPRHVPLLYYYFLLVVLSASLATPRQMVLLIAQAYGLALVSGLYWGFVSSLEHSTSLLALSGMAAVALWLSAQRCRDIALRRGSEQILTTTIDNAAAGVGLADASGKLFLVNPALCTMLGRDAETLLRLSWPELTEPDDFAQELPLVEEMLANRRDSYRVKNRYRRGDGSIVWVDLNMSCARTPEGRLEYFIGQCIDITDVVAQTEYIQTAAAAGVVGIWDWEVPSNVLSWDPVMYRLYGRNPGDFAGAYQAWADAVHPDDRAYAEGEIQAALHGEREYAPRFRVIWPDGSVHHLQAVSQTTYDSQGKPLRMLGVNYDVTELMQTRERLEAEEQRLNTTLDAIFDPHMLLDPVRDEAGAIVDFSILRANPAAAAYNHMAPEAFVRATIRQVWPEYGANGLFDRYREVLSSGQPLVLDSFPFQHSQQGGLRHLDIRAVKVGEELSITWRDVSERIALEQALQNRATTDSLTTLLNREEVFSQIERRLAHNQRRGGELALMFCDLDHFKQVNDRYGHQAGDAVLQAMASRIRSCMRDSDLAARIGGDELMAVLCGVQGLPDALDIAQKVRALASEPVPLPQGEVQITMSVGVALASPGESLDDLIARADAAMYAAKHQGRDQVVAIT